MKTILNIMAGFVFTPFYFGSVLVISNFNINLTEAYVVNEAGYVYSIWST